MVNFSFDGSPVREIHTGSDEAGSAGRADDRNYDMLHNRVSRTQDERPPLDTWPVIHDESISVHQPHRHNRHRSGQSSVFYFDAKIYGVGVVGPSAVREISGAEGYLAFAVDPHEHVAHDGVVHDGGEGGYEE